MSLKAFEVFGEVFLKDNDAERQLNKIDKSAEKTGFSFTKLAKIVGGLAIGKKVLDFGKSAVIAASDAGEMQSKFDTVFGSMNKDAEQWAKKFQKAVGGSRNEIKGMIADSEDMLTGFGMTTEQAFDFSKKIQTLGTDLASFQNLQGGAAEGVERLRKGLLGETENLKAMGIVINETVMKQKAMELGYGDNLKVLSETEKMQIRYAIAVEQSKNAIGDAKKTSGEFANQLRNVKGRFQDITANVGAKLLPVLSELLDAVSNSMPAIEGIISSAFDVVSSAITTSIDIFKALGEIITNLADSVGINVGTMGEAFESFVGMIGALFRGDLENAMEFFDEIISNIFGYDSPAYNAIMDFVNSFIENINDVIGKVKEWVNDNEDKLNAIADKFKAVMGAIKELIGTVLKFLTNLWNDYGDNVMDIVKTAMDFISDVIDTALTLIKDIVNIFIDLFNGDWEKLWDDVSKLVDDVWKGIKKLVSSALDGIIDILKNILPAMKDAGKQLFTAVWEGLKEIWTGIFNWVGNKVNWLAKKLAFWRKGKNEMNEGDIDGARANGGPVTSGKTYLVGERGPELFKPSTNGSIIPNNQLQGNNSPIVIEVPLNVNGREFAKATAEYNDQEQGNNIKYNGRWAGVY